MRTTLVLLANGLTLVFLTSEITAFWQVHDAEHLGRAEGLLARGATLSLAWAAYATAAIVVGIRRRYAPIRYFAMLLFAITILKVFVVDMAELERVYRIVSVIGLGVMLLATSYLYQRFKDVLACRLQQAEVSQEREDLPDRRRVTPSPASVVSNACGAVW